jgi:putative SOS response-associated peptidase YedK
MLGKRAHVLVLQDGRRFAFAGLWDSWKDKATGDRLETFTIVTTDPSEWMTKYHDRLAVILEPNDTDAGLSQGAITPSH